MAFTLNPFASLTKDPLERRNLLAFGFSGIIYSAGIALACSAIGTAFNAKFEITPELSAKYMIPYQIICIVVMMCSTAFLDRVKNRLRFNALIMALMVVPYIGTFIKCLGPASFRAVKAIVAIDMACSIPNAVLSGLRGGADAMVQCRVIHNELRGRFWSIIGVITGLVGLLIGVFVTYLLKRFSLTTAYVIATIPGIALILLAAYLCMLNRELPDLSVAKPAQKKKESILESTKKIWFMREFRIMMPANFMRGMGNGCVSYALLLALHNWKFSHEVAGYNTMVTSVAPFLGYVVLWLTLDRFGAGIVLPVTTGLMALAMIGMVAVPNVWVFLGCTMVYNLLLITESAAIPLVHFEVVPTEVMGAFSNVRLLLLTLTGSISGTLAGICLGCFSPLAVFTVSALIKFASGLLYSYGVYKLKKHTNGTAAAA